MREPIFTTIDTAPRETLTAQQFATAEARAKAAAKLLEPHFPKEVRARDGPIGLPYRARERG
jgi:hypothetical protein